MGMSTMSRGKEIIDTCVCLAFTLRTMIESVSLPMPRASREGFESLPMTRIVMRRESSGLGGFGVGEGEGLAVGDAVGVGDGLGLGEACAIGFGAISWVNATTATIRRAMATAILPIRRLGARANIGRHDTRCMQSHEVTVETGGRR